MSGERLAKKAQGIVKDAEYIAKNGAGESSMAELEVCRIRAMALQVEATEDLYAKLDEILEAMIASR